MPLIPIGRSSDSSIAGPRVDHGDAAKLFRSRLFAHMLIDPAVSARVLYLTKNPEFFYHIEIYRNEIFAGAIPAVRKVCSRVPVTFNKEFYPIDLACMLSVTGCENLPGLLIDVLPTKRPNGSPFLEITEPTSLRPHHRIICHLDCRMTASCL